MIFISHRGNTIGPNLDLENNPDYVLKTIKKGFEVEVDIRYMNDGWFLGHDYGQYLVDESFILNDKIWFHAKNLEALNKFIKINKKIKFFWHQEDDYVLTSNGLIWTYPGKNLTSNSICVLPEKSFYSKADLQKCAGVCSDNVEYYSGVIND